MPRHWPAFAVSGCAAMRWVLALSGMSADIGVPRSKRSGGGNALNRTRPTVHNLEAMKGNRQFTPLCVESAEEAAAASAAGIDILSIIQPVWTADMREAASDCFMPAGLLYDELCASEDYLKGAHSAALRGGGDCAYCAAGMETVARLSAEGIPVVAHVWPVPSKWTWTGGFEAVGKTAETAMQVFKTVTAWPLAGLGPKSGLCS